MNDTTTTENWAAEGHARLGIAGCVLETLANNLDDVELVTTIRLALKELYAGMTAFEDVAMLSDDTLDCVMKIRDLSDDKKSGVLDVLHAIADGGLREAKEAFAPASTSDETAAESCRRDPARNRLISRLCPSETLGDCERVLDSVQDSLAASDDDYVSGNYLILGLLRDALLWEAERVQYKRIPEADVQRKQAEREAAE